jgi:O-antigen ligase
VIFYGGAIWIFFTAVYYIAVGRSETDQVSLSTGGTRILAQGTAMFICGALFLSLLNLEIDRAARRRFIHILITALSLFEIVLSFGRTTFAAVAIVLPILCLFFREVRGAVSILLPLLLPMLVLTALLLPRATPQLKSTLVERITKSPTHDANLQVRLKATAAIWPQVRESPIIGVGFGRETIFTVEQVDKYGFPVAQLSGTIGQDPHDSYVWLLAGGGIVCLGSFGLILLAFAFDGWRRVRGAADEYERLIVVWSAATLFVFLVNALAGPVLSTPEFLLMIWTLLLLPSIVPMRRPPRPRLA